MKNYLLICCFSHGDGQLALAGNAESTENMNAVVWDRGQRHAFHLRTFLHAIKNRWLPLYVPKAYHSSTIADSHYSFLLVSAKHFLPRLSPVYESVFRQRLVWTGLTRSLEETAEHRRGRKPPVLMRCETKPWKGDRDIKWLIMSRIVFLSPFQGFFGV